MTATLPRRPGLGARSFHLQSGMRLFLAAEVPEPTRLAIRATAIDLTRRWDVNPRCFVRPENLHVTLKFIGEVPQQDVMSICGVLERCQMPRRFPVAADRLVCLPERGAIRIVSAGLSGDLDRLHELFRTLEIALAELGIPQERRPFKPHVTFVRLRPPLGPRLRHEIEKIPLGRDATVAFFINDVVLFESHLQPTGARYVPLARFPLA